MGSISEVGRGGMGRWVKQKKDQVASRAVYSLTGVDQKSGQSQDDYANVNAAARTNWWLGRIVQSDLFSL
eukprot:7544795-Ditylum_brightwellii.AAC.2